MNEFLNRAVFFGGALWLTGTVTVVGDEPTLVTEGPKVVVPAPDDDAVRHLSWPKIVRADDGTLVVAYSAGVGHNRGASGLAVSRSTDQGRTFSAPELLCYYPDDDDRYRDLGNVALGVGEDGALILLAMAYHGEKANTILGWRSLDNGRTWQRVDTSALAENKTGSVFGHVFPIPGKGMAVCGHYRQPKGDGLWIATSSDNGKTWGPPETITDAKYFEPVFIESGGKLLGLARENKAHAYHQFVSSDHGRSWAFTERALRGDARAVHPSPFVVADPVNPRRLLALVSERAPVQRVSLWEADRDELRWRRVGLIVEEEGEWDWAYPWMTHLGGNEWFLVYYKGSKQAASIHGARIAVPDQVSRSEGGGK
ncbi:sialidase family protein [Planctomycetes bacterium Pan216]